ncbi:ParB/RepB/Spo0J family partition protein [Candidatus Latescibacterota bacterium]
MARRQVLGKGIHALIAEYPETAAEAEGLTVVQLNIDDIEPNPHQPRSDFDQERLQELADSIREKGVIQPVTVNRVGSTFQLIAGERRWRASRLAGAETIPAIVHEIESAQELMELSLIENIQREDLNAIEEAEGYRALIDTCLLTQEDVAQKVGRDRSTITNTLRLLKLPHEMQDLLRQGRIQMGHARALIPLEHDDCLELGRLCVEGEMTVRELERAVQTRLAGGQRRKRRPRGDASTRRDPILDSFEEKLRLRYATAVGIHRKKGGGRIEIQFYDDDDLERVLELLLGDAE